MAFEVAELVVQAAVARSTGFDPNSYELSTAEEGTAQPLTAQGASPEGLTGVPPLQSPHGRHSPPHGGGHLLVSLSSLPALCQSSVCVFIPWGHLQPSFPNQQQQAVSILRTLVKH